MKFSKTVQDFIQNYLEDKLGCDVSVYNEDNWITFESNGLTDFGENWIQTFSIPKVSENAINETYSLDNLSWKNARHEFYDAYMGFDVNEDVRLWADQADTNGVPDFYELVQNAEFKQDVLKEIFEEFPLKVTAI